MEEEKVHFRHDELIEITNSTLSDLISCDSLLSDLPKDATLDEINSQLEVNFGQSITVTLEKENKDTLPIVVRYGGSVADLKSSIKRCITLNLKRKGEKRIISWKYIWRDNHLMSNQTILKDDTDKLSKYGITTGSKVKFMKKKRLKNSVK